MQCASCQFENMPGIEVCGRCGSPLGLRNLAIDVHPPRAGAWAKRVRRGWLPFRSTYYEVRDAGRDFVRETGIGDALHVELPRTAWSVLARGIVPGWPHLYLGQTWIGRVFLGIYLGLMFLAFLLFGKTVGMFIAGLAFSVHVSSIASVLRQGSIRGLSYWVGVGMTFLILALGVYAPAGWLLSRAVSPAELRHDMEPFEYGDVILHSPGYYWFHEPRPGDVVLYEQTAGNFQLSGNQHGYIRVEPGQRIDRILAGPGDRVRWENNQLTVNGQPAPFDPLGSFMNMPLLVVDVPQGNYLILPSTGWRRPIELSAADWPRLILVPRASINGRAFLRSYPITRIQRIP
jgi:hypothetical protein